MKKKALKKFLAGFMVMAVLSGTVAPVSLIFAVDKTITNKDLLLEKLRVEQLEKVEWLRDFDSEEKMKTFSVDESLKKTAKMKQPQKQNYVEGEVLVKFKERKINLERSAGRTKAMQFAISKNLDKKEDIRKSNISVLKTKSDESVEDMVERLKGDARVEYVEPNYTRQWTSTIPNDSNFSNLWGLYNTTVDADIDAPEAWDIFTGSNSVVVAVLDSGIAYNHPDLINNMWNGNASHGWDFFNNDNNPIDDNGHGTHVAGTIGAEGNNNIGVTGVNWNVKLMALKVGDYAGNVGDIAEAIDFAISNNVKIINASFGGPEDSQAEFDAIDRFRQAGGIFIAAAGNGGADGIGDDNDSSPQYPADYALDNIISVAATNSNDDLAGFSNYGVNSVDVGAPGVDIYSTYFTSEKFTNAELTNFTNTLFTKTSGSWKTGTWDGVDKMAQANSSYINNDHGILTLTTPLDTTTHGDNVLLSFYLHADIEYHDLCLYDYLSVEVDNNDDNWTEKGWWCGGLWNEKVYANLGTGSPNMRIRFIWHTDEIITKTQVPIIDDIAISNTHSYQYMSGTSMATPHVAGLAALIWGYKSELSYSEVKDVILTTGDSLDSLAGKTTTGKRINAFNALNSLASSGTEVSGNITEDTTWTLENSPYIVTGTVQVLEDVKLTIESGVEVRFNEDTGLNIGGELNAVGTESEMITFTSNQENPNPGDWIGIEFINDSVDAQVDNQNNYLSGSIIKYCIVEYAEDGTRSQYSSQYISNNIIKHNVSEGIQLHYSGSLLKNNVISNNYIGIQFRNHDVSGDREFVITGNQIINNSGDGIYGLQNTNATISHNDIYGNENGIDIVGTYTTPNINFNNIYNNSDYNVLMKYNNYEDVNVQNNWWGTTDIAEIEAKIYDYYDDISLGKVIYEPFATTELDFDDQTAPVITLLGSNPVNLFVDDSYTDAGATALDDVDGDITANIVVGGNTVDTGTAGTYIITYNVSDSVGNPAVEVTRTVNVNEVILESIEITNPATKLVYMVGEELDITGLEVTGTYNNGTTQIETITTANITGFDSSAPATDQILTVTVSEKTTTCTVDIIPIPDTTPPIITEEVPVPTPTNNNTPDYTFISDEAGSIIYYGSCGPCSNIQAIVGENVVTFGPFIDGVYGDCTIIVIDESNNASDPLNVSSFTVDTTPPTVEETTPVTTPTSDTTPVVGITVENGASREIKNGDDILEAGVGNGTEQTIALSELGEGTYNLTLTATDEAGNTTIINLSEFEIDLSVSPINLSTLPNNPTNKTTADITVSGDDIVFYKYELDGSGYGEEISIDTNIILSGLSEGEHTVYVIGRDGVGNWSAEISETWTIDLTAPDAPVVTDPAEAVILNADTYSIVGTAEDNSLIKIYSGVELVGSQQLGTGESAYSIEVSLVQNADNNFTATATDLAKNESASAAVPIITEDSIVPVVIITSPTDGLITNQSTIIVEWTINGIHDSNTENLSEGINNIIRNYTDEAGNMGSNSITVILDTTKPVITLTGSDTINLYVGDTYEELGATAEDNVSDAITIDSSDVNTDMAGTYEVTYNVSDVTGNVADEVIRTVIVSEDTTPPVRSSSSPTGVLVVGTTQTTLSLITDEDAICRYSTETGTEYSAMTDIFDTTGSTDHSILVTGLTNGNSYTYYIRCQDNSNNSNANDYEISFSVASSPAPSGGGGGGGYTPPTSVSSVNNPLKITSTQQGALTQNLNNENKVKVEIPKGSIKSTTTFTASEGSLEEGDVPKDKIGAFLFNGLVFNVEAVDLSNNAVREFSEDLTITLTVPDLPDDTTGLELYYYDDESGEWIIITDIEFGDGTITFKVNHLTQFAVFETNATKASSTSGAPEVKGVTTTEILDGDIIQCKSSDNPFAVYIVKIVGDTKYIRHIVSLEIFNYYGHLKWENLKQVESLNNYSLSGWVRYNTGPNGIASPTDKVYEINGDQTKHWINMTAEQFLSHGGSELAIFNVNMGELSLYMTGVDVMSL